MNKILAGLVAGSLAGLAFIANAQQNQGSPFQKLRVAHPHLSCAQEVAQERDSFHRNMQRGLQNGSIDPAEKAALEKTHAELQGMEKKALEDGKMTAQECQAIHSKIVEESSKLKRAMATGGKKMTPQQALAHCKAEIAHERTSYVNSVKRGLDAGLIDAKERADLEKTHNELAAMEKKAGADGKLTLQECHGIHGKILEENRKLKLAMATRPAKGPVAPAGK